MQPGDQTWLDAMNGPGFAHYLAAAAIVATTANAKGAVIFNRDSPDRASI